MKEEALKLADAIDEMIADSESYYGRADEVLDPAADMIRKLVAEIDTYRLKNSNQIHTYRYEPVAWKMESREIDGSYYLTHEKPTREQKISHTPIPLYTAPQTKPLAYDEKLKWRDDRIAELEKLVDELAGYKESYDNCHRMCSGKGMN